MLRCVWFEWQRYFREDERVTVLLMSLKCGSLGLNLTCASRVVMVDPWWNPTTEEQAIDRVHRIGQTRPVEVLRLTIQGTVEDRILALQDKKRKLAAAALGDGEFRLGRLSQQDLINLFGGPDD